MLKEIDCFENDVGMAIIYEESLGGYSIERQIMRKPGLYRCRMYHAVDMAGARKRFNQIKGTLAALQTRRNKTK